MLELERFFKILLIFQFQPDQITYRSFYKIDKKSELKMPTNIDVENTNSESLLSKLSVCNQGKIFLYFFLLSINWLKFKCFEIECTYLLFGHYYKTRSYELQYSWNCLYTGLICISDLDIFKTALILEPILFTIMLCILIAGA